MIYILLATSNNKRWVFLWSKNLNLIKIQNCGCHSCDGLTHQTDVKKLWILNAIYPYRRFI